MHRAILLLGLIPQLLSVTVVPKPQVGALWNFGEVAECVLHYNALVSPFPFSNIGVQYKQFEYKVNNNKCYSVYLNGIESDRAANTRSRASGKS